MSTPTPTPVLTPASPTPASPVSSPTPTPVLPTPTPTPEDLCILEQLIEAVETAYSALVTTVPGVSQRNRPLLGLRRPVKLDEALPLEHYVAQIIQLPVEPVERVSNSKIASKVTVLVIVPIRPVQGDATPIQHYQNQIGARLLNVALASANRTWGDLALPLSEIKGPFPFQDDRRVDGVYLEITIPFRHSATDSFSL